MRHAFIITLAISLLAAPAAFAEEDAKKPYDAARQAEAARDFKAAMAEYDKVLEIDEEFEDAFERWDACHRLVEWQETVEGEVTALDLVHLGEAYLELSRYADERACYEEAIKLDGKCAEAHGHLALWNYTRGREGEGFPGVYRETLLFLRASPQSEQLEPAILDFEIYGAFRNLGPILGNRGAPIQAASKSGDWKKAAGLLEAAAEDESLPMGARILLVKKAAETRAKKGDIAGARKDFAAILGMPASKYTIDARLALGVFDLRDKKFESALEHLKAAVAEGSGACARIAKLRKRALKDLFAKYPEEMEKLIDEDAADEPLRKRIRAAVAEAAKEGKRVLIHWYGPYCPYVMALQERLETPEVRKLIGDGFVYVRVDQGWNHRAIGLDREYGDVMEQHGVPCLIVLDGDGSLNTVQKDLGLMDAEHRSYSAEKIVEFLKGLDEDE